MTFFMLSMHGFTFMSLLPLTTKGSDQLILPLTSISYIYLLMLFFSQGCWKFSDFRGGKVNKGHIKFLRSGNCLGWNTGGFANLGYYSTLDGLKLIELTVEKSNIGKNSSNKTIHTSALPSVLTALPVILQPFCSKYHVLPSW